MIKRLFYAVFSAFILASCGEGEAQVVLRDGIAKMEDSISTVTRNLGPGELLDRSVNLELVDLLYEYYHAYPDDAYAPECLDKIHMVYSALGEYETSAKYADTLLNSYPDYINRAMILESQASAYDIYIIPRDTVKVRYFYDQLLKEFKNLPKDKVEGIKSRLENLDLTIEEMIMQNN